MRRAVLALLLATLAVADGRAQQGADTTGEARARRALRELETLEAGILAQQAAKKGAKDGDEATLRAEQRRLIDAARAALDTAIVRAPDGRRTLDVLEREFPGGALLREYDGWRLLADHQPAEALVRFDGLLRASRGNLGLLRGRARALDALQREPDATKAWARLLDLYPADQEAYDALLRRYAAAQALASFHGVVTRLRILHPQDTILVGREVRLLQAMGLPDSAAAVARRFSGDGT